MKSEVMMGHEFETRRRDLKNQISDAQSSLDYLNYLLLPSTSDEEKAGIKDLATPEYKIRHEEYLNRMMAELASLPKTVDEYVKREKYLDNLVNSPDEPIMTLGAWLALIFLVMPVVLFIVGYTIALIFAMISQIFS